MINIDINKYTHTYTYQINPRDLVVYIIWAITRVTVEYFLDISD